jgi:[citrate (pro-3S)-lyase] ligase
LSDPESDVPKGSEGPSLFDRPALAEARALIEACGLRFEPAFDDLIGLYEQGRLVACAARAGYVLKMLAIAPSHQGSDTLGELVTRLIQSGLAAGQETLFVFTPPQNAPTFQALNFRLLVAHGQAALLEYGPGLPAYLAEHAALITPGRNGAVVVNGNPFTLGHLYLVEQAAAQVDRLYLFVVREDRSVFPFAVRFRLAQEATAHLANVTVLDSSRYAVSAGTFPSYFLKRLDTHSAAQMQIDLRLFCQRLAPPFHVATRFAGQEPLCPTTAAYNVMMAEVLGEFGIGMVELARCAAGGQPISATRVRAAFRAGDWSTLAQLVPPATLAFLRSAAARPIQTLLEET